MKIADSVMRESWQTLIAKVDKYYPNAKNNDYDYPIWAFIVSEKRKWMYDVVNRVWCNQDRELNWTEPKHPLIRYGSNVTMYYRDIDNKTSYRLTAKKYLNGNTLVTLTVEKYGKRR